MHSGNLLFFTPHTQVEEPPQEGRTTRNGKLPDLPAEASQKPKVLQQQDHQRQPSLRLYFPDGFFPQH